MELAGRQCRQPQPLRFRVPRCLCRVAAPSACLCGGVADVGALAPPCRRERSLSRPPNTHPPTHRFSFRPGSRAGAAGATGCGSAVCPGRVSSEPAAWRPGRGAGVRSEPPPGKGRPGVGGRNGRQLVLPGRSLRPLGARRLLHG